MIDLCDHPGCGSEARMYSGKARRCLAHVERTAPLPIGEPERRLWRLRVRECLHREIEARREAAHHDARCEVIHDALDTAIVRQVEAERILEDYPGIGGDAALRVTARRARGEGARADDGRGTERRYDMNLTKEQYEALPPLVEADCVEGTEFVTAGLDVVTIGGGRSPQLMAQWVGGRKPCSGHLISRGPAAQGRLLRRDDPPGTRFRHGSGVLLVYNGGGRHSSDGVTFPNSTVLDPELPAKQEPAPLKVGDILTPENARPGVRWSHRSDAPRGPHWETVAPVRDGEFFGQRAGLGKWRSRSLSGGRDAWTDFSHPHADAVVMCLPLAQPDEPAPPPAVTPLKVGDVLTPENARPGVRYRHLLGLDPYALLSAAPLPDAPARWRCVVSHVTGSYVAHVDLAHQGIDGPRIVTHVPDEPAAGMVPGYAYAPQPTTHPVAARYPPTYGIAPALPTRRSVPCMHGGTVGLCSRCDPMQGMTTEEIRAMCREAR